jgi:hypothetical protein
MTATTDLTLRERAVLEAVELLSDRDGYPPTVTELCAHLDLGRATVHRYVVLLRDKGAVTSVEGHPSTAARTLRSTRRGDGQWVVRLPAPLDVDDPVVADALWQLVKVLDRGANSPPPADPAEPHGDDDADPSLIRTQGRVKRARDLAVTP